MEIVFYRQISENSHISISRKSAQCKPSCSMQPGGETGRHYEARSRFPQFCESARTDGTYTHAVNTVMTKVCGLVLRAGKRSCKSERSVSCFLPRTVQRTPKHSMTSVSSPRYISNIQVLWEKVLDMIRIPSDYTHLD